jgi:hypothetical protein
MLKTGFGDEGRKSEAQLNAEAAMGFGYIGNFHVCIREYQVPVERNGTYCIDARVFEPKNQNLENGTYGDLELYTAASGNKFVHIPVMLLDNFIPDETCGAAPLTRKLISKFQNQVQNILNVTPVPML